MGEVECRQVLPLPQDNLGIERLLPMRPPASVGVRVKRTSKKSKRTVNNKQKQGKQKQETQTKTHGAYRNGKAKARQSRQT